VNTSHIFSFAPNSPIRLNITANTWHILVMAFQPLLRFVAVINDASSDVLKAALQWIPASSALYSVLVTSQLPPEQFSAFQASINVSRYLSAIVKLPKQVVTPNNPGRGLSIIGHRSSVALR
jgi:hypothetical protein